MLVVLGRPCHLVEGVQTCRLPDLSQRIPEGNQMPITYSMDHPLPPITGRLMRGQQANLHRRSASEHAKIAQRSTPHLYTLELRNCSTLPATLKTCITGLRLRTNFHPNQPRALLSFFRSKVSLQLLLLLSSLAGSG